MKPSDAEFLKTLQAAFRVEAEEHLQAISSGLLRLEKEQDASRQSEIVSVIFREAHSLKGAARAVNSGDIESICQSLETVFASWKQGDIRRSPDLFDPLHAAVNAAGRLLPAPDGAVAGIGVGELADLLGGLASCASAGEDNHAAADMAARSGPVATTARRSIPERPSTPAPSPPPKAIAIPIPRSAPLLHDAGAIPPAPVLANRAGTAVAASETLRISTVKLDALLLQAEEMLAVKLTAAQRAADLRQLADALWVMDQGMDKDDAGFAFGMGGAAGGGERA